MAPPPEHDKEPKAPDKIGISANIDESKTLQNQTTEQLVNSDHSKPTSSHTNSESDDTHVETLDDGQLRALLDEAITYKCPKDREGKSTLFKELLEKVERQDDQATTAASRGWGVRSARVKQGAKNRRGLPHSNSLQDLVDALAAERAHRTRGRHHTHHASQQSQAPVSARTHHGGSLPSGVDTSFLLGEEPVRCGAAEYVATVLCVNPAPLSERRVSASDAHSHLETEPLTRRSKPSAPMTYTARATLEIGSTSGRALTTTTASNQVRNTITSTGSYTPQRCDQTGGNGSTDSQRRLITALTASDGGGVKKNEQKRGPRNSGHMRKQSEANIVKKVNKNVERINKIQEEAKVEKKQVYKRKEQVNIGQKQVNVIPGIERENARFVENNVKTNVTASVNKNRDRVKVYMPQKQSQESNSKERKAEENRFVHIIKSRDNKSVLINNKSAFHVYKSSFPVDKSLSPVNKSSFNIKTNSDTKNSKSTIVNIDQPIKILQRNPNINIKQNSNENVIHKHSIASTSKTNHNIEKYPQPSTPRDRKEVKTINYNAKINQRSNEKYFDSQKTKYEQEWQPSELDLKKYGNWYQSNEQTVQEPPRQIWGPDAMVYSHNHQNVVPRSQNPTNITPQLNRPQDKLPKNVLKTITKPAPVQPRPPNQIWGPDAIVRTYNHKHIVPQQNYTPATNIYQNKNLPQNHYQNYHNSRLIETKNTPKEIPKIGCNSKPIQKPIKNEFPGNISTGPPARIFTPKNSIIQNSRADAKPLVQKNDPFLRHFYQNGVYKPPSFKFVSKHESERRNDFDNNNCTLRRDKQVTIDNNIDRKDDKIKVNVTQNYIGISRNILPMSIANQHHVYKEFAPTLSNEIKDDNIDRKNASVVKDNETMIIDSAVNRNNDTIAYDNKHSYQLSAVIESISCETDIASIDQVNKSEFNNINESNKSSDYIVLPNCSIVPRVTENSINKHYLEKNKVINESLDDITNAVVDIDNAPKVTESIHVVEIETSLDSSVVTGEYDGVKTDEVCEKLETCVTDNVLIQSDDCVKFESDARDEISIEKVQDVDEDELIEDCASNYIEIDSEQAVVSSDMTLVPILLEQQQGFEQDSVVSELSLDNTEDIKLVQELTNDNSDKSFDVELVQALSSFNSDKTQETELIDLTNSDTNAEKNESNHEYFTSQIEFLNMIKTETHSKLAVIQEETVSHDNEESPSFKEDCLEIFNLSKDEVINVKSNKNAVITEITEIFNKENKISPDDEIKENTGLVPFKPVQEVVYNFSPITDNTIVIFNILKSAQNDTDAVDHDVKSKDKKKKKSKNADQTVQVKPNVQKSLRMLLFENLFKDKYEERKLVEIPSDENKVDSGIPFSCITTPEVVTSCSSSAAETTQQTTIAVESKPLQLSFEYNAVSSVTGEVYAGWSPPRRALGAASSASRPLTEPRGNTQPRTIATTFNGLPLSRPNYSSTATSSTDDFKKSTDENGNSVQGLTTPSSGSSQHKKNPRRKKSSKNETVIKSDLIDGYQGNKDLDELLKFIESNADNNRGHKLGRVHAKHKDDSDERTKKRSSDRRRDKERVKRASSLEEVSRTTIEELTTPRRTRAPADSQRRSWGDDYRVPSTQTTPATPVSTPPSDKKKNPKQTQIDREPGEVAVELTEFQTVTKRKKQRKRGVESAIPPPAARRTTPSPRRKSAPPSDRSGDSTDDMESVHSLPARPAPPTAPASYADIARTRHNIPDLIESCNYYTEDGTESSVPPPEEEYPALCPPRAPPPPAPPAPPDVVVRPPVILRDEPRAPELDGVTFGFDVNEQLLKTATTRRCDLVRESAVNVRNGLRYLPPPSPPTGLTTELIVDYVGQAWEDIIKCGSGKVRYFSE